MTYANKSIFGDFAQIDNIFGRLVPERWICISPRFSASVTD